MFNRRQFSASALATAAIALTRTSTSAQTPAASPAAADSDRDPLVTWDDVLSLDPAPQFVTTEGNLPENLPGMEIGSWEDLTLGFQDLEETLENWKLRMNDVFLAELDPDRPVVVFDPDDIYAALGAWTLQSVGTETYLLQPNETVGEGDFPEVEPAGESPMPDDRYFASFEQMQEYLDTGEVQIIDARAEPEWQAEHIPGAMNLEYSNVIDEDSGAYHDPDTLTDMLDEAGVDPGQPVVTYCQTGMRASVLATACAHAGIEDVRVYLGSWNEWKRREGETESE